MKSKIFITDQIRAIQDVRMTQFMEVVKPQPWPGTGAGFAWSPKGPESDSYLWNTDMQSLCNHMMEACPFGKVGDVIAVRESWVYGNKMDGEDFVKDDKGEYVMQYYYKAIHQHQGWFDGDHYFETAPWKSPTTMPHEAARLFLRITNIRVMRVQELEDTDFIKQAVEELPHSCIGFGYYEAGGEIQECFCMGWEHSPIVMGYITGGMKEWKNKKAWDENKFYWIIDFEKIDKPITC